jgi:hypothetical protein
MGFVKQKYCTRRKKTKKEIPFGAGAESKKGVRVIWEAGSNPLAILSNMWEIMSEKIVYPAGNGYGDFF